MIIKPLCFQYFILFQLKTYIFSREAVYINMSEEYLDGDIIASIKVLETYNDTSSHRYGRNVRER